jgi:hypothetical protein
MIQMASTLPFAEKVGPANPLPAYGDPILAVDPAPAPTTRPLTADDRCDRCWARGYVLATFAGGELVFCAHHGRQYAGALAASAQAVQNESDQV